MCAGADFDVHSMQPHVHSWQKCLANGGDHVDKQHFVAQNLLYQSYCAHFTCCSFHKNKKEALLLEKIHVVRDNLSSFNAV